MANPAVLTADVSRALPPCAEHGWVLHTSVPALLTPPPAITPLTELIGVRANAMQTPPANWHCSKAGTLPAVMGSTYTPPSPHCRAPVVSIFCAIRLSATVETVVPSVEAT